MNAVTTRDWRASLAVTVGSGAGQLPLKASAGRHCTRATAVIANASEAIHAATTRDWRASLAVTVGSGEGQLPLKARDRRHCERQ
jgi:hypothetical protein